MTPEEREILEQNNEILKQLLSLSKSIGGGGIKDPKK